MQTKAVVFERPGDVRLRDLALKSPTDGDVVVDVRYSGVSTGTERLLFTGEMPRFPGMGYPLVPGYECVGQVAEGSTGAGWTPGDWVFVPGSSSFRDARGLFGGSAARLVVPTDRPIRVDERVGPAGSLLALAATAYHALHVGGLPELIVGHGALGRLLARLTLVLGGEPPLVWETNARRQSGAVGYEVRAPDARGSREFRTICDASGDPSQVDTLVACLEKSGVIVLAGFYERSLTFDFPNAFLKEAQLRIAAEWQREDLDHVADLVATGRLSLDGLVTHVEPPTDVGGTYRTAFGDSDCVKMVIDWRDA